MKRQLIAGAAMVMVAVLAMAAPAHADITSGNCDATIAGVAVKGRPATKAKAIKVKASSKIIVSTTSGATIDSYEIKMTYVGYTWTVATGTANDTSWQREVDVAKYAKFGTGYYLVKGVSSGAGACSGEALVKITGRNPLTTVAGGGSAAIAAGAALGIGVTARRARRRVLRPGVDHSPQYHFFQDSTDANQRAQAVADTFASATSPADYVDATIAYANAGAGPDEMAVLGRVGEPVRQHVTALCDG